MHFLRVNATFYDAVSMIHDVITTASLFPYTVKFMFVGVRNNKTQTNQTLKDRYISRQGSKIINSSNLVRYF